ncbi:PREDICTED: EF-hand domain-containing protein D1 [Chaetura pelagica]|uniref:EF-hand domain-containing protein D1 n=1 Tax=Chaetura pelagica TaxID=8897 RepID=UPI000523D484|nr:PREDICTED: EF-hand domain-containing protein D1 [Chaetura pelagica]
MRCARSIIHPTSEGPVAGFGVHPGPRTHPLSGWYVGCAATSHPGCDNPGFVRPRGVTAPSRAARLTPSGQRWSPGSGSACRSCLWQKGELLALLDLMAEPGYDSGRDGYIDLMELKLMMEKLGAPQTHLGLKNMIKEVDEDFDGKLSFRECLLIFHKAAAGELEEDSGLLTLAKLSEIDVSIEGVKGAKNFFEAKAQALSSASKFEAEIKAEQDERKREEEERKHRRAAFRELKSAFTQ